MDRPTVPAAKSTIQRGGLGMLSQAAPPEQAKPSPNDRSAGSIKRMTPRKYAEECGVGKDTVYAWVKRSQLPQGARAMRPTGSNRLVIEVDMAVHPAMPLLTEER